MLAEDHKATTEAYVLAADGGTPRIVNRYRHKAGSVRFISWAAAPAGQVIYATGRDITAETAQAEALARTEETLRQAQKMDAVGQLTGGIAHDFNNMLAVVIGSLDLLNRRLGEQDVRARRHVQAATDSAKRAALLTQRLLAFSRRQPLRPRSFDINELVVGMSELIRGSLGGDIRLETALQCQWRAHADPNQVENALLNLSVNARDAMPGGGRLLIATRDADFDDPHPAPVAALPAGQYVAVAVTDTGSGMSKDVLAKAFDPFFTTKPVGEGTGLGLSQVYGFVTQSGGYVIIDSELGEGTTVTIYLPRLVGAEDGVEVVEPPPAAARGVGREVILVVEDEPAVRQFSVDALRELGYRVLEAESAAAALNLLSAHPEVALMFTDVVMPDVDGGKLARQARLQRPDLKVLFTTGYTRDVVIQNGVLEPGVEVLGKPYSVDELARSVRAVLDERRLFSRLPQAAVT